DSLLLRAQKYFSEESYDSAKFYFKKILKNDKNSIEALRGLGKIYVKQEKWGDAKDIYKKLEKVDENPIEAHYYLGICYRETGKFKALIMRHLDWKKAKSHFESVLAQDSLFDDVLFQYAKLMRYWKNYEEAIRLCREQIRLKPELVEPQVKIFRLYRYFITHNSEKKVLKYLSQFPNPEAQFAIAEKFRREGKFAAADSIYQSLLKNPGKMWLQPVYLALARLNYQQGKRMKAQSFFWRAVNEIENDIQADLVFEDIKYIVTDEELHRYRSLKSAKEKNDFFRTFWNRRDPTPGTKINARLAEHYRRLNYAEKNYEYDGFRTWFNNPDQMGYFKFNAAYELNNEFHDKGLIYIRQGKPDEWARTAGMDVPTNESWLYYQRGNMPKMMFHFFTHNSPGAWRFSPIIENPEILEDRLSWDNVFFRMLRADPLERLAIENQMALESKKSVFLGTSTDRHAWEEKVLPLNVPFTIGSFRSLGNKTRLEIDYAVSLEPLRKEFRSLNSMKIDIGITIFDKSWHQISQNKSNQSIPMSKNKFSIDLFSTDLPPDSYHISMYVKPEKGKYLGGWKVTAVAEDFTKEKLSMSDIVFAEKIEAARGKNKFNRGDLFVLPNPMRQFFRKRPMYIYFELYNLTTDSNNQARFEIEYSVEQISGSKKKIGNLFGLLSSGKSTISTFMEREISGKDSQEYLAIDVSHLKKGRYQLTIKVTDSLSGDIASRSGRVVIVD
ncbi:MAG: GWxTD domain-containing protein, partial [Calditrichaeota bacterium]|nr:GWxTD domain-containing protein [Calditrichota bacterium]